MEYAKGLYPFHIALDLIEVLRCIRGKFPTYPQFTAVPLCHSFLGDWQGRGSFVCKQVEYFME